MRILGRGGWGRSPRACAAAIAFFAAAITGLLGLNAAAASAVSAPQPTFVASSPVLKFTPKQPATTTVQVLNPGPAAQVRFELVLLPGCKSVASTTPSKLLATGVTTLSIAFKSSFDTSFTGATLVMVPATMPIHAGAGCMVKESAEVELSASAQFVPTPAPATQATKPASAGKPASTAESTSTTEATPQAITLSLRRETTLWGDFWIPLLIGLGFAVLVTLATLERGSIERASKDGQPDAGPQLAAIERFDLKEEIKAGSSWNYKDSIATNVTAVGALLGSFLAAAGSTSTLLPGIETSRFSLLSAFWGGVAAFAPLVLGFVSAKAIEVKGKPATSVPLWLLLIVTMITLTAVGAEISTVGVLVSLANVAQATRTVIYVLLGLAGLLAAIYVAMTNGTLVGSQGDEDEDPRSGLNHFAETALAA